MNPPRAQYVLRHVKSKLIADPGFAIVPPIMMKQPHLSRVAGDTRFQLELVILAASRVGNENRERIRNDGRRLVRRSRRNVCFDLIGAAEPVGIVLVAGFRRSIAPRGKRRQGCEHDHLLNFSHARPVMQQAPKRGRSRTFNHAA